MLRFYQLVRDVNPNHRNISMTVTDGPFFAEKALLSNQEILYKSPGSEFFSQSHPKLEEIDKSGAYFIDGCHVFCEQLTREKKIVICGDGHVSIPLIQMSRMLGFQVQVLENRPKFADHARRAGAFLVLCEPFEQGLSRIPGDRNTFFVIVTRGHRYDQACLTEIARKEHAYIGMIGSKKKSLRRKRSRYGSKMQPGSNP